ncbi:hypothetical protein [Mucilaginibacter sp. SJ]|uniref:hypothetical protein n=1 Tax=Mucilaginibacter sp. SJ TaxID=3029053 RepID=UPI0023A9B3A8|nr:hypothetical protein [Mucilaginibacter sp. SJ]WEA00723.1 hypothetical protein MusilaSJ_25035 [Mucilaginibacter sp. SJ]
MKTTKSKLPKARVNNPYTFKNANFSFNAGKEATSQGDPTNFCTTILTTSHFI